jgi:periplasmic divalent cation tolerance protein
MTDKIVAFCTCSNAEEAGAIARRLVESRLAACVNILPGVRSTYRWQGKVESAEECLLLIKSSRPLFAELRSAVEELHSYEVPELIALPVVDGAANYLNWLAAGLKE